MAKKKLVYIVSDVEKSLAFEWTAEHLRSRFDLFFLLLGKKETPLTHFLDASSIRYGVIADADYPSRIKQWFLIFGVLRREKPAIVHIHLWRAMLLGLPAAWLLRVPRRIFTRHHATLHHREHPSGLKWDKLCNSLATDIIAISANIRQLLIEQEGVPARKVHLVHHGFDLQYFYNTDSNRVSHLRHKIGLDNVSGPVVGVIARYTEWKGIQFTIQAFEQVLKQYPTATLVLANAHGDYAVTLRTLLNALPEERYVEIAFEEDLSSLYRLFDVFVHVPTDPYAEAFGQTYVEALAAGVPSVFTRSGVACEFIEDGQNALVVKYCDAEDTRRAIVELLENKDLRDKLVAGGRSSVKQFELKNMLNKLDALYA